MVAFGADQFRVLEDSPVLQTWVFDHMLNPLYSKWYTLTLDGWRESRLHDHWLFQWAPDITGFDLFALVRDLLLGLVLLYMVSLLCMAVLRCMLHWIDGCGDRPQSMPDSDTMNRLRQQVVQGLLKTPRDKFPDATDVHGKIEPVMALTWPWRGGGLLQRVALLLLDVGLDINTVFTFLAAQQYVLAAMTVFLMVRSCLKQLLILAPWRLREAC